MEGYRSELRSTLEKLTEEGGESWEPCQKLMRKRRTVRLSDWTRGEMDRCGVEHHGGIMVNRLWEADSEEVLKLVGIGPANVRVQYTSRLSTKKRREETKVVRLIKPAGRELETVMVTKEEEEKWAWTFYPLDHTLDRLWDKPRMGTQGDGKMCGQKKCICSALMVGEEGHGLEKGDIVASWGMEKEEPKTKILGETSVLHDPFCWDAMQRYMDCNSKMFLWVWRKKKKKKSTKRDNTGDPSTKTVGKRKRRPSQARKGPGDGEKGNKRPRNEKPGGETTGGRGGVVGDGADAGKGGGHAKLKTGDLLAQFYIQTEKKRKKQEK